MPPDTTEEHLALLKEASEAPKGIKIAGRDQKAMARALFRKGLANINKSVTRMTVLPAGQFVLERTA